MDKLHGVGMPDRFRSAEIRYIKAELISGAVWCEGKSKKREEESKMWDMKVE